MPCNGKRRIVHKKNKQTKTDCSPSPSFFALKKKKKKITLFSPPMTVMTTFKRRSFKKIGLNWNRIPLVHKLSGHRLNSCTATVWSWPLCDVGRGGVSQEGWGHDLSQSHLLGCGVQRRRHSGVGQGSTCAVLVEVSAFQSSVWKWAKLGGGRRG